MPTRIAHLGPAGTYGEQATLALVELEGWSDVELVPCVGLRAVVERLADGDCSAAVVPVENSVEGGVTATLGCTLGASRPLHPSGPGAADSPCSAWLCRPLLAMSPKCCPILRPWPNVRDGWRSICRRPLQLPTSSTAEAARMVVGSRFRAAIASRQAQQEHGLDELAFPVNDVPGNCTRFLLLQRGRTPSAG